MNREAVARAIWNENSPDLSYDEALEGEKIGIRADIKALEFNRDLADAAISAMGIGVKVKDLGWREPDGDDWDVDEYGVAAWGDFSTNTIVLLSSNNLGIYRHSDTQFMWVDGTDTNVRHSTYRNFANGWNAQIPWHSTIEAAKAAAQADYENRILSALQPAPVSDWQEAIAAVESYPADGHGYLPTDPHDVAEQVKSEILATLRALSTPPQGEGA